MWLEHSKVGRIEVRYGWRRVSVLLHVYRKVWNEPKMGTTQYNKLHSEVGCLGFSKSSAGYWDW